MQRDYLVQYELAEQDKVKLSDINFYISDKETQAITIVFSNKNNKALDLSDCYLEAKIKGSARILDKDIIHLPNNSYKIYLNNYTNEVGEFELCIKLSKGKKVRIIDNIPFKVMKDDWGLKD